MKAEEIQHMLDMIESEARSLSKWEADFVESIRDQFEERGTLSERQAEILSKIYAEKT